MDDYENFLFNRKLTWDDFFQMRLFHEDIITEIRHGKMIAYRNGRMIGLFDPDNAPKKVIDNPLSENEMVDILRDIRIKERYTVN